MKRFRLNMRSAFLTLSTVLLLGTLSSGCRHAQSGPAVTETATVVGLVCDSLPSPPSVGSAVPLLGWRIESNTRAWRQSAYQIRVASEPRLLAPGQADLWDSGHITSTQTLDIPYQGRPLAARQRAFWSVRVWDAAGLPSAWSAPAEWTTGIFNNSDWQARWISAPASHPRAAAPLLRREFSLDRPLLRATARLASLGWSELTVNGRVIGDDVLGPPFTDSTRRILYVTRDITAAFAPGPNVLGLSLGNGQHSPVVAFGGRPNEVVVPGDEGTGYHKRFGRFGPPAALLEVELEFTDGSRAFVGTDADWRAGNGPVTFNDLWRGEKQDLRLAQDGWDRPDFDASAWPTARAIAAPAGLLEPNQLALPRRRESLSPDRVTTDTAHFTETGAGWPRLQVNGTPGQKIVVTGTVGDRFKLHPLEYILRGGPEVLEPKWFFNEVAHTVKVAGLGRPLEKSDVSFQLVYSDPGRAGDFTCSDAFLNSLHAALLRTHQSYSFGLPMDPSREKQSWTQDVQNMMDSAVYLSDSAALYRSWWRDMRANQTPDGNVGAIVPVAGIQTQDWNCPWWGGMIVYLPWKYYEYYGDRAFLAEAYEPMRAYVDFLGRRAAEGTRANGGTLRGLPDPGRDDEAVAAGLLAWGTGDWMGLAKPPVTLTSTAAWSYYASVVARTAALLGHHEDAARYTALVSEITTRFNRRFLDPATGRYGSSAVSQSALAVPLALDLVPAAQRDLAFARLLDAVNNTDGHINTGFVGTPFILRVLSENGRPDVAARLVTQRDYPGWATLMKEGVFKENWKGEHALMPSLGGPVGAWLYRTVLGIRPAPDGPGFSRIMLQPEPVAGLTWACGHFDSRHGRIRSDWRIAEGTFHLEIEIPANTSATVSVPSADAASVRESDTTAASAPGVRFLRHDSGRAVFTVGSGTYHFTAPLPAPAPAR
jgi:alpha-L-rhamnosidase